MATGVHDAGSGWVTIPLHPGANYWVYIFGHRLNFWNDPNK